MLKLTNAKGQVLLIQRDREAADFLAAQAKAQSAPEAARPACWHRKAETAFLLALSLLLVVLAALKF